MIMDRINKMSLFVGGYFFFSSMKGKAAMLIRDMDITTLMIHLEEVEEDKLSNIEEFKDKRVNTFRNELR